MNKEQSRQQSILDAFALERAEHPAYDALEQFVDGTADDVTREIVASHCEVCTRCDEDVHDLRAFAGHESSPTILRWLLVAAAVAAVLIGGGSLFLRRSNEPRVRTAAVSTTASGYGREDWNAAVRDALARGSIDRPTIVADLRPPEDALRGAGSERSTPVLSPAGEVLEATTPVLRWRATSGRFVVTVYDGFERVARSGDLESPEWRVTPPLARGRTYTWQVEIRRGSSVELLPSAPAPPAYFHVLGERDSSTLAEARRRFPEDSLLMGVLYARLGMQHQAVEALRAAATRRPDGRAIGALADRIAQW